MTLRVGPPTTDPASLDGPTDEQPDMGFGGPGAWRASWHECGARSPAREVPVERPPCDDGLLEPPIVGRPATSAWVDGSFELASEA